MDSDKNGTISKNEFKLYVDDLYLPPTFHGTFDKKFKKFDTLNKGCLSVDE